MKSATFGRRMAPQIPKVRAPRAAVAQSSPAVPQARPGFFARLPWLTVVLCGTLVFRFLSEFRAASDYAGPAAPGHFTLLALGASSRDQVLGAGEWWRLFTAPLLHGSPSHLSGNLIALLLAGCMLEPLVGIGWFGAIYFTGGFCGALFSMLLNPPGALSVGASGAIMSCLACMYALSYHEGVRWPKIMRRLAGALLFPALGPSIGNGATVDINAHMGGLVAGVTLAFVLLFLWPEDEPHIPGRSAAALVAGGFVALTVLGFSLSRASYDTYVAQAVDFIPQAQMRDAATNLTDGPTSMRLAKYPQDPRAHLLRAIYDLEAHDLDAAEMQTQQAEQMALAHGGLLIGGALRDTRGTLAIEMARVRGAGEGRRVAKPLCTDPALEPKWQHMLADAHLCSPG